MGVPATAETVPITETVDEYYSAVLRQLNQFTEKRDLIFQAYPSIHLSKDLVILMDEVHNTYSRVISHCGPPPDIKELLRVLLAMGYRLWEFDGMKNINPCNPNKPKSRIHVTYGTPESMMSVFSSVLCVLVIPG